MNFLTPIYKKNIKLFFLALLVSFSFLTVCTKSSFLYPFNDWVDANCFFTMGKAMMQGETLYVDLYEQKGPFLYFIHGIAWLISSDTFLGVFLFEVLFFAGFLFFSVKIANLYLQNIKLSCFVLPILGLVIPVSHAFSHGDSAEELCLLFLVIPLYLVLRSIKQDRFLSFKEMFVCGICGGCVFYIKYTMMGFFIGLAIYLIFACLSKKQYKILLNNCLGAFTGFIVFSIPFVIYMLCTGSLQDWFQAYIYNNIFLYSNEGTNRIWFIISTLVVALKNNFGFGILLVTGIIWIALKSLKECLFVLLTFTGLIVFIWFGCRSYLYYALILSVYSVFGATLLLHTLKNRFPRFKISNPGVFAALLSIVTIPMIFYACIFGRNVYLTNYSKEQLPQYQFAEYINEVENARVLNYGFLDGGFYTVTNILPDCKYFCTLNIELQEMHDTQKAYIVSGKADFVITRDEQLTEESFIEKYELLTTSTCYFENKDRTYYLYKRIP